MTFDRKALVEIYPARSMLPGFRSSGGARAASRARMAIATSMAMAMWLETATITGALKTAPTTGTWQYSRLIHKTFDDRIEPLDVPVFA